MTMSCKKAAKLASEAQDRKLSMMETMSLKMHMGICSVCRIVAKNFEMMKKMTKIINQKIEDGEPIGDGLSEEAATKIKKNISSYKEE